VKVFGDPLTSEGLGIDTVNTLANVQPGDNYSGPGKYRHHKGGVYRVEGLAIHESDLSCWVVYRSMRPDSSLHGSDVTWWIREHGEFNEMVDVGGEIVPRFERISK
jgi:hypothetical protein